MSTIARAGQSQVARGAEAGNAHKTKAPSKSSVQAPGFGSVLEKLHTQTGTESRRACPQQKGKSDKSDKKGKDDTSRLRPEPRESKDGVPLSFEPWMRADGAFRPEAIQGPRLAPRGCAQSTAPDRVLVGSSGLGPEARVRIGGGPLAGTEIQLVAVAGGVEARVLTVHEGSRQTLSVAMDEIAQRLRRKGHSLRMDPSQRGQERDREDRRGHSDDE